MKRLICSIVLVTILASVTSAQQASDVSKVFTGGWKWVSYAGGADRIAPTDASGHYVLYMSRDEAAPGLVYHCRAFKDSTYFFTTSMEVTVDVSNPVFPYKLHYDVLAPLFNGAALPSVNFRIVENSIIEFSNGITTDYRYLFKNIDPNSGC